MGEHLEARARAVSADQARIRPPDGSFSLVEHVWHLADLEKDGFAERIRRIVAEENPTLADFDGARVARERNYRSRDMAEGLGAFQRARAANTSRLRALTPAERSRAGVQDGVGSLTLQDIPTRMLEHDASHRKEIDDLMPLIRPR